MLPHHMHQFSCNFLATIILAAMIKFHTEVCVDIILMNIE